MKCEFLPEARDEFAEAALYYESKPAGLGTRFRDEVAGVIAQILADPLLSRERADGDCRVNCPVFPYYVAYFMRPQKIVIAAVAHGHRRPGYWRERLKNEG